MFHHSAFSEQSFSSQSWKFDGIAPVLASLGAAPDRHVKKRIVTIDDEIEEAIGAETVSRIQNEFLSEALTNDVIKRAKVRKARAEEALLLLLI